MPELPELEALRIRLGPRLEGQLVTAAEVNPRHGHLLRHPPDDFARELPIRRFVRAVRGLRASRGEGQLAGRRQADQF